MTRRASKERASLLLEATTGLEIMSIGGKRETAAVHTRLRRITPTHLCGVFPTHDLSFVHIGLGTNFVFLGLTLVLWCIVVQLHPSSSNCVNPERFRVESTPSS